MIKRLFLVFSFLGVVYFVATPFITSYQIFSAIDKVDDVKLSSYINYVKLSRNLSQQAQNKIKDKIGFGENNQVVNGFISVLGALFTTSINEVVKPENIRLVLQTGVFGDNLIKKDLTGDGSSYKRISYKYNIVNP